MTGYIDITIELKSVIDKIIKSDAAVAIVCFGHYLKSFKYEGCYQSTYIDNHHFDLLVILRECNRYKDHEINDLINSCSPENTSVNVLCHSEPSILSALKNHHQFFGKILSEGKWLYRIKDFQFDIAEIDRSKNFQDEMTVKCSYTRAFDLSDRFFQMASDAIHLEMYDMSVFLLHQSVEQLCIASIKAHLGFRATTHSIMKLIDLVGSYLISAKDLFPCNTLFEKELYCYLHKAYTDVRYKVSYDIPSNIAVCLFHRVRYFRDLVVGKFKSEFEITNI
jgi:HEPN domain-containing protein